jgi:hypothetical protein
MVFAGVLAAIVVGLSGCSTNQAVQDVTGPYYSEKNNPTQMMTFEMVNVDRIEGSNMAIRAFSYKPAKSIVPANPTIVSELMDGLKTVAPWLAVGYWGSRTLESANQTRVVRPEVVRPEVVNGGAAAQ